MKKTLKFLVCSSYCKVKACITSHTSNPVLHVVQLPEVLGKKKSQQLGYVNSISGKCFVESSPNGHFCEIHTQVTLSRYNSITVRTVKFGHILRVLLQNVHLHGTTLSEASMADVTFIWLLSFSSRRKKNSTSTFIKKKSHQEAPNETTSQNFQQAAS